MKIIQASVKIMTPVNGVDVLRRIETCGRVCYKSEGKITDGSAEQFVRNLIQRGHESVLEHVSITIKFICDRGVSHEIVRHRLASYSQESTRYCNYSKDCFSDEITVIKPVYLEDGTRSFDCWRGACETAESAYFSLLKLGCSPQEARAVLPNSLKTEVVMTANLREWRHFFKLRTSPAAHPQMREVACMALAELRSMIPVVFDDYEESELEPEEITTELYGWLDSLPPKAGGGNMLIQQEENGQEKLSEICNVLGTEEIIGQLTEECGELVQAAQKLRRAIKGTTPVKKDDALVRLAEECADVLLCVDCLIELGLVDMTGVQFIGRYKMDRWHRRVVLADEA